MNERVQIKADEALEVLVTSLEDGKSETLTTYLAAMARFHRYSWFNSMLIWSQRPTATRVAGFKRWLDMGRRVRTGEKGIMILAPILTRRAERDEAKADSEQIAKSEALGFTSVFVFDVSQTDGEPLPTLGQRSGDPGVYAGRLLQFAQNNGIRVEFAPELGGAHGLSRGGHIQVLDSLPPAEQFGVLVHEISHELLHQGAQRSGKPKVVKELEAEATAFVVCHAVGIEDGSAARDYIQLYQGDSELLMASFAAIQRASSRILAGILD